MRSKGICCMISFSTDMCKAIVQVWVKETSNGWDKLPRISLRGPIPHNQFNHFRAITFYKSLPDVHMTQQVDTMNKISKFWGQNCAAAYVRNKTLNLLTRIITNDSISKSTVWGMVESTICVQLVILWVGEAPGKPLRPYNTIQNREIFNHKINLGCI